MTKNIVFIHGMFQNGQSWDDWVRFFSERGYTCSAPSWPQHEGRPADLRAHPPADLGRLSLNDVIAKMTISCSGSAERPILIGHSVGGLVAQVLAARGLASAAVCISSVAPNDLIALDLHLLKNVTAITNPLKGHQPYEMTPEGFRENFCNTLSAEESAQAYEATATHDSRQVLRDCLGRSGHIDLAAPHVPLLFLAGDHDHIIPAALNRRNREHYTDASSVTDYREFANRGHFICGAPGWTEVATAGHAWIESQGEAGRLASPRHAATA